MSIEEMSKYIRPRPWCDEAHGDNCECSDGVPEEIDGDETTPVPFESMRDVVFGGGK